MICFSPAAPLRQEFQKQIFKGCKPGSEATRDTLKINYNDLLINALKKSILSRYSLYLPCWIKLVLLVQLLNDVFLHFIQVLCAAKPFSAAQFR